jgi:hypothetical protein
VTIADDKLVKDLGDPAVCQEVLRWLKTLKREKALRPVA